MRNPGELLEPLLDLHGAIRDHLVNATDQVDGLHLVAREDVADTIYVIDDIAEGFIAPFAMHLSKQCSVVIIAEGMEEGARVWPRYIDEGDAAWRIIIDPIDGTRGLMYQKRSGWILTAIAPNRGLETSLQDIVLAVQTEIPLRKQYLSDQVVAVKGQPVAARRYNRLTGKSTPLQLLPSTAPTIAHGFATVSRFFPGGREALAAIDDEIVHGVLGPAEPGKALCFEDQYASTGGQLYELLAGHDRFIADLRPLVQPRVSSTSANASVPRGLCCHPYDICTSLIATESGVIITDPRGNPLNAPLDVTTDVAWVGYANQQIQRQIEPLLQAALRSRGWI